jgi:hypothetical protein
MYTSINRQIFIKMFILKLHFNPGKFYPFFKYSGEVMSGEVLSGEVMSGEVLSWTCHKI